MRHSRTIRREYKAPCGHHLAVLLFDDGTLSHQYIEKRFQEEKNYYFAEHEEAHLKGEIDWA